MSAETMASAAGDDQAMVDEILSRGRRFYVPGTPTIPVEFQTSAFRFAHSMIRPSYRANLAGDNGQPFFGMVFDPSQFGQSDPEDMSGGHRAPAASLGGRPSLTLATARRT